LAPCEKAGEALGRLRRAAGSRLAEPREGDAEASLAPMVARSAAGVGCRRDLPSPDPVAATVATTAVYANGRAVSHSAAGASAATLEGTFERVVRYERRGGKATMTVEKSGKTAAEEEKASSPPEAGGDDEAARLVGRSLE